MTNFMIVFDNGGGATLQVAEGGYVHNYDDMDQLAQDVIALAGGDDAEDWDGHEDAARISDDYLAQNIDNGGYRILSQDDWDQADIDSSWRNIRDYAKAIQRGL